MSPASIRIRRWWETVAGVTPRNETIWPQFICLQELIASKMRRRVLSASALEMFSIFALFIGLSLAEREPLRQPCPPKNRVTIHLDIHRSIEVIGIDNRP